MAAQCECVFVGVGLPMDTRTCLIHEGRPYPCPQTSCSNYRPIKEKLAGVKRWPKCVCGEIAQEHN